MPQDSGLIPKTVFIREAIALYRSLMGYPLYNMFFTSERVFFTSESAPLPTYAPVLAIKVTRDYGVELIWSGVRSVWVDGHDTFLIRTFRPPETGLCAVGHGTLSEVETTLAEVQSRVWGEVRSLRHLCQTCPQILRLGPEHPPPSEMFANLDPNPDLPGGWTLPEDLVVPS